MAKRSAMVETPPVSQERNEPIEVEDVVDEVEVSEDEEAEEEDSGPSRQERRRERGRKWREEHEERLRAAEERARNAELQAAQAQGFIQAQQRAPETGPDPVDRELEEVYRQQKDAWEIWQSRGKQMSADEVREMEKRARSLKEREHELLTQRSFVRAGVQPQMDPMQQAALVRLQTAVQTHASDIVEAARQNPRIWSYGQAELRRLIAAGYPDNEDTLVMAAESTRKQFGMKTRVEQRTQRPNPPRHSLTGVSAGGRGSAPEPVRVKMTTALKSLAEARFPNLEPEEAHKKWAAGPGLRAQQRIAAKET